MNALSDPRYIANKPSNASFTDAAWIQTPEGKVLWLLFKSGTVVTGTFNFKGAFVGTDDIVDIVLPTGTAVHNTASAGSVAQSTNTIALTGFTGTFAIGLVNVPPQLRVDFTRSSGGSATGSSGFQVQTFQRAH